MSRPLVRIVELDGSVIDREMNDEEYELFLKDQESDRLKAETIAAAETAKSAAIQKLTALGLTADDLIALGLTQVANEIIDSEEPTA